NVSGEYAEVRAGATVGSGCKLAAGASIGEGAVIEAGARIGPNASVGRGCVVREGASLTSAILLDDSTVGAGAALVNVMLDAGVEVGDGERITGMPDKVIEILASRG
ncbi:MAG: hypothetical protein ABIF82_00435, partial [Planctomycetota bacterium]